MWRAHSKSSSQLVGEVIVYICMQFLPHDMEARLQYSINIKASLRGPLVSVVRDEKMHCSRLSRHTEFCMGTGSFTNYKDVILIGFKIHLSQQRETHTRKTYFLKRLYFSHFSHFSHFTKNSQTVEIINAGNAW